MPVLQTRVIAIINAGMDYKQALDGFADHLLNLTNQAYTRSDHFALLEEIKQTVHAYESFLKHPRESDRTLYMEYEHFSKTYQRNIRYAETLRGKRGGGKHRAPIHAQYELHPFPGSPASRRGDTAPNQPHPHHPLLQPQFESPEQEQEAAAAYQRAQQQRIEQVTDYLEKRPMRPSTRDIEESAKARNITPESAMRDIEEAESDYEQDIEDLDRDIFDPTPSADPTKPKT